MIVLPITILVIFMILYTMFSSFKWALLMLANIAMAPLGGLLALCCSRGTTFQRVVRGRLSGAVRRLGADRRHHAGVHQSTARARPLDRGCRGRRRDAAAAPDHDDDAGGDPGPAAGGTVARHRLRFAAAVRDRDRRRADGRHADQHLPAADAYTSGSAGEHDLLPAPEASFEEA